MYVFDRDPPLQDWGVLRPWITGSKAELEDLSSSGVYIVGTATYDSLFPQA